MTWEEKLRAVVSLLWDALPESSRLQLRPVVADMGAETALPAAQETWVSTIEVALEFGLSPSSIRTNWPRQYGIRPEDDRWRGRDIQVVRVKRQLKGLVA